ncbi:aspartyl/asparaginyl beta-hydroxylase domain-containing protein [Prosthecobacter sp.]|uniref:aspartyl/asparaginyl beta-hydroxylase domain-containing protein n=1 Tax=Prosthecobacter sp. TaxID=1965333 RepID=UPI00378367AC
MNITQHQYDWNLFKGMAGHGRVQQWAGSMRDSVASFLKAVSSVFLPRPHVSSLRVTWAGVLRSERDQLVPEASEEMRFQVASQMFLCEEGKTLVFDDTWNQDAWDSMNGYRVEFATDSKRQKKESLRHRLRRLIVRKAGR